MKHVRIGNWEFSKAICGTNAFYGRSHFSEARDAEYHARFSAERIERMVQRCIDRGINTVESSANAGIDATLATVRARNPQAIHFVGSTRIDETSEMKSPEQKLDHLLSVGAQVCIIHAQWADRVARSAESAGLERWLEKIHAAGLLAGISTHQVKIVEMCEQRGYAIDTYMFPLNPIGFVYPGYPGRETVQQRVDLVRGVAKPFILMKTLGAGRIPPTEGLQFVAENSKPNDVISIGFGTEEELDETVQLVEKYF